jgi:hypothetical protein
MRQSDRAATPARPEPVREARRGPAEAEASSFGRTFTAGLAPAAPVSLPPALHSDERWVAGALGRSGGRTLHPALERPLAAATGVDLGGVRLHDDPGGHDVARRVGARAVATGDHIATARPLHPGLVRGDLELLAHEVAHVAQIRRSGTPSMLFDGLSPWVEAPASALSRWPALVEALSPEEAARLGRSLSRRILRGAGQPEPAGDRSPEVSVSVRRLMRPRSGAGAGEGWQLAAVDAALLGGGSSAVGRRVGGIVEAEMLRRWLAGNATLLDRQVRVAVLDPDGTTPMLGALVFQIGDLPVSTEDGALYARDLDAFAELTIDGIQEALGPDLGEIGQAAGVIAEARGVRAAAATYAGKEHADVAQSALPEVRTAVEAQLVALAGVRGTCAARATTARTELRTWLDGSWASFERADAEWRTANPDGTAMLEPMLNDVVQRADAYDRLHAEGRWAAAEWTRAVAITEMLGYGFANMFSGDAPQQSLAQHQSYRAGNISFNQMREVTDAVETRGLIVGGITVALTLATMGVGGLLARSAVGLGGRVAIMGGLGMASGGLPPLASNLYTRLNPLQDPTMQQWWSASAPGAGQILLGAGLGFATGAAFGLGSFMARQGSQLRALVVASEQNAALPRVPNATASVVRPGVVRVDVEGLPGYLEVTRQGWTHMAPAGTGSRMTAVGQGAWGPEGVALGSAELPWASLEAPVPNNPFAVGVTGEGWVFGAPRANNLVAGAWDDALFAGGARSPTSPLLLPPGPLTPPLLPGLGLSTRALNAPFFVGGAGPTTPISAASMAPVVANPLSPALIRTTYAAELLTRPALVLHLDAIATRAAATSPVLGPSPAIQALRLEEVLLAARAGAPAATIDAMIANIYNPMTVLTPRADPVRLMTNCGYCSIARGLEYQSPTQYRLPETLYGETRTDLGVLPDETLPRSLLFPLAPGQSTTPTSTYGALGDMGDYTLESVASARGLRASRSDLPDIMNRRYDPATRERIVRTQVVRSGFDAEEVDDALRAMQRGDPVDAPLRSAIDAARQQLLSRPMPTGHYIIGYRRDGMGHFMNIELRIDGTVVAMDTQVGTTYASWADLLSSYGMYPTYSVRVDPPR